MATSEAEPHQASADDNADPAPTPKDAMPPTEDASAAAVEEAQAKANDDTRSTRCDGDGGDDGDDDWKVQRDASKLLGDEAFRSGRYADAAAHYSAAIDLDPDFAVAYSNRSACHLRLGEKSRALRDAESSVQLGFGTKGHSRWAAALQSLGRWEAASEQWRRVLQDDPSNAAALAGLRDCQRELELLQQQSQEPEPASTESTSPSDKPDEAGAPEKDELDDFFDEVENATRQVAQQKRQLAELEAAANQPQPTNAIKHHKRDLGTAQQQTDRLLQPNYLWKNLNPFWVLDLPHTASTYDISRRYKALSLLLHPDKNRGVDDDDPRVQDAYDQVQKAKATLDDEHRANHCKQLVEMGLEQGRADWEKAGGGGRHPRGSAAAAASLEEAQSKAVQKVFAEVEYRRREVERRERSHEQREREREQEEAERERSARTFDKSWKKDERVEKRIGSWRRFQKKPKL